MPEREPSEIPKHLKEGVPSVGAYEQAERREYQIAEKAWRLQIPRESLARPFVKGYVGVLRDLETGADRITTARELYDVGQGSRESWAEREAQVHNLYVNARVLLEDGLGSRAADPSSLKHSLDNIGRRYGAKVEYDRSVSDEVREGSPRAEGLWSGRPPDELMPEPPWRQREEQRRGWWLLPDVSPEQQEPEHLGEVLEEALRQGRRPDLLPGDPQLHTALTRLVHARKLAEDVSELARTPDVPGLTPSAGERLRGVALPLTQLAVRMYEEEFSPGKLPPSEVTGALNTVGRRYGLKIT